MNPRGTERGFTLLELLVAVTITMILAGLMVAVVTNTLNLWQRSQDNFSGAAQAKLALDLLERDLQAAIFKDNNETWLAVDIPNVTAALTNHGWLSAAAMRPATTDSWRLLPGVAEGEPLRVEEARFGLSGAWLRLITTNVEMNGSLPVAVSYQIARRPVSGAITASNRAEVRYSLLRAAVTPENTFVAGHDLWASAYASNSVTSPATRTAKTVMNPNTTDVLANNVVDFAIWLYVHDSATHTLRRIFPADATDFVHAARHSGASADANRFPDAADVMIRIMTEHGATVLAEMESATSRLARPADHATDAAWWWSVVEANSHTYVRRVAVKGVTP